MPDLEALWEAAATVTDPEIPVLSVVDLGIVREIRAERECVVAVITPTYSGCPALQVIASELEAALRRAGAATVRVETVYQPPWTTDWISERGRAALRASGIAPPGSVAEDVGELVPLVQRGETVPCPYCASARTELRSHFGPTACKAIYFCNNCTQPFEYFKPL
jgi:ring-1,2-phenylacetyl-CoA epoxidase subunit PaaD